MRLIRFMFREITILYSPVKWSLCILFVCMVPIITYAPRRVDVLNTSEIYMPLIGILLLVGLPLHDIHARADEIIFLSKRNKAQIMLVRYFCLVLLMVVIIAICYVLLYFNFSTHGYIFHEDPFRLSQLLMIVMPGSLFLGAIAMIVSRLFVSEAIGILSGLSYWAYWMVSSHMDQENVWNLFAFANKHDYIQSKGALLLIGGIMLLVNLWFANQSPLLRIRLFKNLK